MSKPYRKGVQKIRLDHLKKGVQCPYCKHKHITTQDLINDPRIQDVEILGEYIRNDIKIKCRCKKCGRILYITPNHLQQGKGCKYCHNSLGENKIINYLDNNNINYKYQYIFDDCKNIHPLPFDFYLPDYNICIEYNGEQHYRAVEYFGSAKSFRKQKKRDKIKEQYCKNNNIKLIIIPYTQFNSINKILDNMLETVTTAG